jgi:hypothetical protein
MKKTVKVLAVCIIFSMMAALAFADVFCLKANVPTDKTLKAYKFTVTYDPAKVKVVETKAVENTGFTATINDKTAGTITVNGFNVEGVKGKAEVSVMNIVTDSANANFTVVADDFGSGEDKFEAEAKPVVVKVK